MRSGLFGRGVIALSEAGHARVASLPPLLADDLAASLVFGPDERVIVPGARVVVHVPRTAGDLLRRRVRAAMGVNQVEQAEGGPGASARTRPRDLLALVRAEPWLAPRVAVFLAVAVAARRRARARSARGISTRPGCVTRAAGPSRIPSGPARAAAGAAAAP